MSEAKQTDVALRVGQAGGNFLRRARRGSIKISSLPHGPHASEGELQRKLSHQSGLVVSEAEQKESATRHEEWYWVPSSEGLEPGKILERKPGGAKVVTREGKTLSVKEEELVFPLSSIAILNENFEDMVEMVDVNEGTILHNVRKRFQNDDIYTFIGTILVAVNPFKWMESLFDIDVINYYRFLSPGQKCRPHLYSLANNAYKCLLDTKRDQSIIISGESGAGKTEATKKCLQYFAEVATSSTAVDQKLLAANPVLEAFGNAKTVRNDNSSRFGKWMEVQFDTQLTIFGCRIENYLLEKSRVVSQANNERNFHIFYQLCAGADDELRKELELGSCEEYAYLNKSCYTINGLDDKEEMVLLHDDMKAIGLSKDETQDMFRIVAAVLHLGNLKFAAHTNMDSGEDGSTVLSRTKSSLMAASRLLGVDPDTLSLELCSRVRVFMKKEVRSSVLPSKASDSRDSLAKALYGHMFDWLVKRVNASMVAGGKVEGTIGVLDIFGFEIFPHNSFEQLCINFCNEKLQQHFNNYVFKMETQEYMREGIDFQDVVFHDNQDVLDLIEKPPYGLLPMLNDEIKFPKGSDKNYLTRVGKAHTSTARFYGPGNKELKLKMNEFAVAHYAGAVTYDSTNFYDKNKDEIFPNIANLMTTSANKFVAETLFGGQAKPSGKKSGSKKVITQAGFFSGQLNQLMKVLYSTDPHYIRCVKPNSEKKPDIFQGPLCLQQLRYAGVFEAVKIRQEGYPFRWKYEEFYQRHHMLVPYSLATPAPGEKDPAKLHCLRTRKNVTLTEDDYQALTRYILQLLAQRHEELRTVKYGKTKVFYKAIPNRVLQTLRVERQQKEAKNVQRFLKGYMVRVDYSEVKKHITSLRSAIRERTETGLYAALDGFRVSQEHWLKEKKRRLLRPGIVDDAQALYKRVKEENRLLQECEKVLPLDPVANPKEFEDLVAAIDRLDPPFEHPTVTRARNKWGARAEMVRVLKDLRRGVEIYSKAKLSKAMKEASALESEWGRFVPAALYEECDDALELIRSEAEVTKGLANALLKGGASLSSVMSLSTSGAKVHVEVAHIPPAIEALRNRSLKTHEAVSLLALGTHLMNLRQALEVADWKAVEQVLETIDKEEVAVPEHLEPEVTAARTAVENRAVADRAIAMFGVGAAAGPIGATNRDDIRYDHLEDMVKSVEQLPVRTAHVDRLLAAARILVQLRKGLKHGDWEDVEMVLKRSSESLPEEVSAELHDAMDRYEEHLVEEALSKALRNGSAALAGGHLDYASVNTTEVQSAAEEAANGSSARVRGMCWLAQQVMLPLRLLQLELKEVDSVPWTLSDEDRPLEQLGRWEEAVSVMKSFFTREPIVQLFNGGTHLQSVAPDVMASVRAEVENAVTQVHQDYCEIQLLKQMFEPKTRITGAVGALSIPEGCFEGLNAALSEARELPEHHARLSSIMEVAALAASWREGACARDWPFIDKQLPSELLKGPMHLRQELTCVKEEASDTLLREKLSSHLTETFEAFGHSYELDVGNVAHAELKAIVATSATQPLYSDEARALIKAARTIVSLRGAVVKDDWGKLAEVSGGAVDRVPAQSLRPLARGMATPLSQVVMSTTAAAASPLHELVHPELEYWKQQSDSHRFIQLAKHALQQGPLQGSVGNVLLSSIDCSVVARAIAAAKDLELVTEEAKSMLSLLQAVHDLRKAVQRQEWEAVPDLVSSARVFRTSELVEEELALCEAEAKNVEVVKVLQQALSSGGPSGDVGALELSLVTLHDLSEALALAERQGVASSHAECLVSTAAIVLSLRTALLSGDWDSIRETLGSGDVDNLAAEAEAEVTLICEEYENQVVINGLTKALSEGRITGVPGDLNTSTVEVAYLRSALREAVALSPTTLPARRLIATGQAVLALREAVLAGDWLDVESIVTSAEDEMRMADAAAQEEQEASVTSASGVDESEARSSHRPIGIAEIAIPELELARAEARDRSLQAMLKEALATGGLQGTVGHASLDGIRIDQLQYALKRARAWSTHSQQAAHLSYSAHAILRLRRALLRRDWDAVNGVLQWMSDIGAARFSALNASNSLKSTSVAELEEDSGLLEEEEPPEDVLGLGLIPTIRRTSISRGPLVPEAQEEVKFTAAETHHRLAVARLRQALEHGKAHHYSGLLDLSRIHCAELRRAIAVGKDVPVMTEGLSALLASAHISLRLREALLSGQTAQVAQVLKDAEDFSDELVESVAEELRVADSEAKVVGALEQLNEAMSHGGPRGEIGSLEASGIHTHELQHAIVNAAAVTSASPELSALLYAAEQLLAVRSSVAEGDWEAAAAVLQAINIAEMHPRAQRELYFVKAEIENRTVIGELYQALTFPCISGDVGHLAVAQEGIDLLQSAISYADRRGIQTTDGQELYKTADKVLALRKALKADAWHTASKVLQQLGVSVFRPLAEEPRAVEEANPFAAPTQEEKSSGEGDGEDGDGGAKPTDHAEEYSEADISRLLAAKRHSPLVAAEVLRSREEVIVQLLEQDIRKAFLNGSSVSGSGFLVPPDRVILRDLQVAVLNAGPLVSHSEVLARLCHSAEVVLRVREAVKSGLVREYNGAEQRATPPLKPELEELLSTVEQQSQGLQLVQEAQAEVEAFLLVLRSNLARSILLDALKQGPPGRTLDGRMDVSAINNVPLDAALIKVRTMGKLRPSASRLVDSAKLVGEVRAAGIVEDWAAISRLLQSKALDTLSVEVMEEIHFFAREAELIALLKSIETALKEGPVRGSVGELQTEGTKVDHLEELVLEASASEVSSHHPSLLTVVHAVKRLRSCVLADDWNGVEVVMAEVEAKGLLRLPGAAHDELELLQAESRDRKIRQEITHAIQTGRAVGSVGHLATYTINTARLDSALANVDEMLFGSQRFKAEASASSAAKEGVKKKEAAASPSPVWRKRPPLSPLTEIIVRAARTLRRLRNALRDEDYAEVNPASDQLAQEVAELKEWKGTEDIVEALSDELEAIVEEKANKEVANAVLKSIHLPGVKGDASAIRCSLECITALEASLKRARELVQVSSRVKNLLIIGDNVLKLRQLVRDMAAAAAARRSAQGEETSVELRQLLAIQEAAKAIRGLTTSTQVQDEATLAIEYVANQRACQGILDGLRIAASYSPGGQVLIIREGGVATLGAALVEAKAVEQRTPRLQSLLDLGNAMQKLRERALEEHWKDVERVLGTSVATLPPHIAAIASEELQAFRAALAARKVVAVLQSGLAEGPIQGTAASIDISAVKTGQLAAALGTAEVADEPSDALNELIRMSRLALQVRRAALSADWEGLLRMARQPEKRWPGSSSDAEGGASSQRTSGGGDGGTAIYVVPFDPEHLYRECIRELRLASSYAHNQFLSSLLLEALAQGGPQGVPGSLIVTSVDVRGLEDAIHRAESSRAPFSGDSKEEAAATSRKSPVKGQQPLSEVLMPRDHLHRILTVPVIELVTTCRVIKELRQALRDQEFARAREVFTFLRQHRIPLSPAAAGELNTIVEELNHQCAMDGPLSSALATPAMEGELGELNAAALPIEPLQHAIRATQEVGAHTTEVVRRLQAAELVLEARQLAHAGNWEGISRLLKGYSIPDLPSLVHSELQRLNAEAQVRLAVARLTSALQPMPLEALEPPLLLRSIEASNKKSAPRDRFGRLIDAGEIARRLHPIASAIQYVEAQKHSNPESGLLLQTARMVYSLRSALLYDDCPSFLALLREGGTLASLVEDELTAMVEEANTRITEVKLLAAIKRGGPPTTPAPSDSRHSPVKGTDTLNLSSSFDSSTTSMNQSGVTESDSPDLLGAEFIVLEDLDKALNFTRNLPPPRIQQLSQEIASAKLIRDLRQALKRQDMVGIRLGLEQGETEDLHPLAAAEVASVRSFMEARDTQLALTSSIGEWRWPHNTLGGDLDVAIGRAMRVRGPYSVSHNAQLKMALDTAVYVRTLRLECETKNWPRLGRLLMTAYVDEGSGTYQPVIDARPKAADIAEDGSEADTTSESKISADLSVCFEAYPALEEELSRRSVYLHSCSQPELKHFVGLFRLHCQQVLRLRQLAVAVRDQQAEVIKDCIASLQQLEREGPPLEEGGLVASARRRLQDIETLHEDIREAIAARKFSQLRAVLDTAEKLGVSTREVDEARQLSLTISQLSDRAATALATVKTRDIKKVLEEAEELGVVLAEGPQLKRLLSLPIRQRLQLQLRSALARNDIDAVAEATCDIKTLFFSETRQYFDILEYPKLFPPKELASSAMSSAESFKSQSWFKYSPTPLSDPVSLSLSSVRTAMREDMESLGDMKKAEEVVSAAKTMNEWVLGFLEEKSPTNLVAIATQLLRIPLHCPLLRDELYLQVIKQAVDNPSPTQNVRSWQLLFFLTKCFPPSESLENYVEQFIRRADDRQLLLQLHRTVFLGARKSDVTLEEVDSWLNERG